MIAYSQVYNARMDENPYRASEIPGHGPKGSPGRHDGVATLVYIVAVIVLILLAAFFFTAVVANEWGAWAPPGKDNPHCAQLKSNADFYRMLCFVALAGALVTAVRGYLKRKKYRPATHC